MAELYRRLVGLLQEMGMVERIALVGGLTVLTSVAAAAVIVFLPADHFKHAPSPMAVQARPPVARVFGWLFLVVRNLFGLALVLLGFVMALPLVPGPGLVFMLLGLGLVDLPGKRGLERRLLSMRAVAQPITRLRARFSRPPLELD